jgi:hypothetical protein
MKTLQIDEKKARGLYKNASDEFKSMLEDAFGTKFFRQSVLDRIKSFEDACYESGLDPNAVIEDFEEAGLSLDEINYKKLKIIAEALNEGWKPDFSDLNQKKWFPWHRVQNGSLVFSYSHLAASGATTYIGSRLCCRDKKTSDYFGTQFIDEWAGYLL